MTLGESSVDRHTDTLIHAERRVVGRVGLGIADTISKILGWLELRAINEPQYLSHDQVGPKLCGPIEKVFRFRENDCDSILDVQLR